ncbi:MAG: 30S ribosomal protein S8 [Thermoplasmata archaeon]
MDDVTRHDLVSGLFVTIEGNEAVRNRECLYPASKLIANILRVLQRQAYIGEFEYIEDGRGGKFKIQLLGRVNRCRSVRPRHSVRVGDYEKWEKMFLPARGLGVLVVTTPRGVMSQLDAKKEKLGGKLLGYVY